MAIIAEELGEAALAQQARDRVKPYIEGWLGGTNGDKLVYEQVIIIINIVIMIMIMIMINQRGQARLRAGVGRRLQLQRAQRPQR